MKFNLIILVSGFMENREILQEYWLQEEKLVYTVKEVSQKIKDLIDNSFVYLWIEGELQNFRPSQSGHLYFSLVEEDSSIKGIFFKDQKNNLPLEHLKEGMRVLVFGKISYFTRSGEIFLISKKVEPVGVGRIHLQKEYLLKKYANLFDPNIKKEIPPYPKKIALVTSLFSAAIQDFLKVSEDRWDIQILVYPVRVQGDGAHLEIVQAIEDLNRHFPDLDLIVITRGGGSLEDLYPFYTEEIILGVRRSKIPIVSAVGHEIDYTLCDLAADKRCPTPSSAAQEIIPDKRKFIEKLDFYLKKLSKQMELQIINRERILKQLHLRLQERNPFRIIHDLQHRFKDLRHRLNTSLTSYFHQQEKRLLYLKKELELRNPIRLLEREEQKISHLKKMLMSFSPLSVLEREEQRLWHLKKLLFSLSPYSILERGYSIVKSYPQERLIKSAKEVSIGDHLVIRLSRGKLWVTVWKREVEEDDN